MTEKNEKEEIKCHRKRKNNKEIFERKEKFEKK